jgi:hypothetical protein
MWMKRVAIFVSSFAVVACVLATQAAAQLRLNEILGDPARDWDGDATLNSRSDEWLEIVNTGASSVDLSSYRVGDLSGGMEFRHGFTGTLAPGATLVVYGSQSVAWEQANGFTVVGLSLNNAGDTVFLFDLSSGDTVVVDEYTYDDFEVLDDRSTGRSPDGTGPWEVFDALNPYSGQTLPLGNGCAPTPGESNECSGTVPVEESTWGRIKAMWTK